ncbi:MAG: NADH-quinone oxidoreductase subunit M [Phycisphaerales bacterium]|nr:NADH-quinone oxidoreductase subunit M [Phycisphaerales bacterium]
MNLALLIAIPLVFAFAVALSRPAQARLLATIGTLLPVALYIVQALGFPWLRGETDFYNTDAIDLFPSLGVRLSLNADTVSMLLIGLTVLLGPICVIGSYTAVQDRLKTYYGWLLVLQAAMTGVFAARDAVLFFVFFEFTLVPMYILISLYGSTNRKAAATKFFLYTFTGSVIMLAGLAYIAWVSATRTGEWSFDLTTLTVASSEYLSNREQAWVFGALMLGFAVKVPLFPLHTWLPLAHTEAPTAGSVILAGVLLKLGTYGMYKFVLPMCPEAALAYAPLVAVVSIIGILYAGLICWVQTDVKKLVAYSSVSHLGFCVLGLFSMTSIGLTGSLLYMINHGLSTGALFLLIGMMYERYHTRSMKELGGLAARMPVWATFMVFFVMSSVGLPGLNGFVSELYCLLGTFQAGDEWAHHPTRAGLGGPLGPWFAAVAAVGMIVGAMYLLYMVGKVVWGPLVEPHGHGAHAHGHRHSAGAPASAPSDAHAHLPADLTPREIGILLPLAALCIFLGVYPRPVLKALEGPTQQMVESLHMHTRGSLQTPWPVGAPPPPRPAHTAPAATDPHDVPANQHPADEPPAAPASGGAGAGSAQEAGH